MNYVVAIPVFAAAICWTAFVVWYWLRAKWWKGPIGRNTMGVSVVLLILLLFSSLLQFRFDVSGSWRWNLVSVVGGLIYATIAWLGIRRIFLMEAAQREMEDG